MQEYFWVKCCTIERLCGIMREKNAGSGEIMDVTFLIGNGFDLGID